MKDRPVKKAPGKKHHIVVLIGMTPIKKGAPQGVSMAKGAK